MDPMGMQELALAGISLDKLTTLLDIQQNPEHLMLNRRTTTEPQLQRLDEAIRALMQSPQYAQILARYHYPLR